jgi:uncharacterized protein (TIGR02466 family)
MIIETIFANWISYENLSLDNKSIEEFCHKKRIEDPIGRVVSNKGGWQSNDLYIKNDELKELMNIIIDRTRNLAENFSYSNTNDLKIDNYWININKSANDYNIKHRHPKTVIVAIYYVKVPKNSGEIVLHTPIQDYDKFIFENMMKKYNAYNSSTYSYIPKTGDLILFPAWLYHSVLPNQSGEERISIAFNNNYRR